MPLRRYGVDRASSTAPTKTPDPITALVSASPLRMHALHYTFASAHTDSFPTVTNIYNSYKACSDNCGSDYAFAIVQYQSCWCSDYIPADQGSTGDCDQGCPGYPGNSCGNADSGLYGYIALDKAPSGTAGGGSSSQASSTAASTSSSVRVSTSTTLSSSSRSERASSSVIFSSSTTPVVSSSDSSSDSSTPPTSSSAPALTSSSQTSSPETTSTSFSSSSREPSTSSSDPPTTSVSRATVTTTPRNAIYWWPVFESA